MSPLVLLFTAVALFAQDKNKYPKCEVVLTDTAGARTLFENLPANATTEQFNALAAKFVRILGEFKPVLGEERLTTKTYALPDTSLTVTASVYFTDESMPGGDSVSLGLLVAKGPAKDALAERGSSIAETPLTDFTLAVRTKTLVEINKREHLLKLECYFADVEEFGKRLLEYHDHRRRGQPPLEQKKKQ